ncbi:MAG TPA: hypothetical protein VM689_26405 [Aliidongia sp.]|nr:hypothetical protein [Aliidongia sp.]
MRLLRLLGLAAFLLLASSAEAADQPFQRMVLAPGCYVLEPHAFTDVSAFCLDEEKPAPGHGVLLAYVPDALSDTSLKLADHRTIGLQEAIEKNVVRLEGLGGENYFHVRIRNLGDARIEICINAPTVLMGNSGYATADLSKIYAEIVRVLPRASDADKSKADDSDNAELEAAVHLQKKLWDIAQKARDDALDKPEEPVPAADGQTSRAGVTQRGCVGDTGTTVICSGK